MKQFLVLLLFASSVQAEPVCRDSHGRICRSREVVKQFIKMTHCPSTGENKTHVVDHVKALSCAKTEEERKILDSIDNMQCQTIADAKAKDRIERKECGSAD